LIDSVGWRAIFLLNIPLAAAAIGLISFFLRDVEDTEQRAPLDLRGALFASSALLLFTWGLTVGAGHEGWTASAATAMVGGTGLLILFLRTEHVRRDAAMMPIALFNSLNFVGLSVLTLLLYGALGAMLVLVPYLLIEGAGFSATIAGAALLPFPLVISLVSPAIGGIAGRLGSRVLLALGSITVAAGFLLMLRFDAVTGFWGGMLPAILVISIGMAGAVAPLTTAVLASVDGRHTGAASGLNSAIARLGGLVATAMLGGLFSERDARLFSAFHTAMAACALAALVAGLVAFAFVGNRSPRAM